ncbi:unnamed protein product, partial [Coregonus sp. 'balchen']
LSAAAVEIFGALEKAVEEYQEENDQLYMSSTNAASCNTLQLSLPVSEEEVPPEQQHREQEWSHIGQLKMDMRIHRGEGIYRCHDCGKTFALKIDLHRHFTECRFCKRRYNTCKLKTLPHLWQDLQTQRKFVQTHDDSHRFNQKSDLLKFLNNIHKERELDRNRNNTEDKDKDISKMGIRQDVDNAFKKENQLFE